MEDLLIIKVKEKLAQLKREHPGKQVHLSSIDYDSPAGVLNFHFYTTNNEAKKKIIKPIVWDTIEDLVSEFVYYGRKEDEDLSYEELNEAVKTGVITKDEIIAKFSECINNWNPE